MNFTQQHKVYQMMLGGLTDRLRAVLTERSRSFIDLSKSLQGMDESKDYPWIQGLSLDSKV